MNGGSLFSSVYVKDCSTLQALLSSTFLKTARTGNAWGGGGGGGEWWELFSRVSAPHAKHRFPVLSSRLCQNWLHH